MDQTQAQPTPKQQISELLRRGSNFIVMTPRDPTVDQAAAVLGLTSLLGKINKNAQGVASGRVPRELDWLPSYTLASKPEAQRDFVITLDTSKTEADKLKYTTEGKRLKVYITPFNGNFTKDDVSFDYGDYHVDAVVTLGIEDPKQLMNILTADKDLVAKARVVTINNKGGAKDGHTLSWYEDASSLSEMVMSMSEALGSGILDKEIATVLLTGIIAATEHFQAPNTTPKVMTMAAQLMAAGADQVRIMQQLAKSSSQPTRPAKSSSQAHAKQKPKPADKPKDDGRIEMKPAEESSLKGSDPASLGISAEPTAATKPQPQLDTTADSSGLPPKPVGDQQPPAASSTTGDHEIKIEPPQANPTDSGSSLSPFMAHQFGADAAGGSAHQPVAQPPVPQPSQNPSQPPTGPSAQPSQPQPSQAGDVEAARRAVEQATSIAGDTHHQLRSHYSSTEQNPQSGASSNTQGPAPQNINQPPQFPQPQGR